MGRPLSSCIRLAEIMPPLILSQEGWASNGDFWQDPRDGEWFHVREAMEIAHKRIKGRERSRRFRGMA